MNTATIYRYNLPTEAFVSLEDEGMWVAKTEVTPIGLDTLTQLPKEHQKCHIEVRALDYLLPLKGVWQTSIHASGIRLRNAQTW